MLAECYTIKKCRKLKLGLRHRYVLYLDLWYVPICIRDMVNYRFVSWFDETRCQSSSDVSDLEPSYEQFLERACQQFDSLYRGTSQ